ncbi:MAG: ATP-dependent Clp protease ATP-binding subunit [Gemmatimonadetes bacterium]|nr:ATP-dependent Clp protease ATP-binding subunit [Gemmatimonadota bacterium]
MSDSILDRLTDKSALLKLLEAQSGGPRARLAPDQMAAKLRERVRGQDHVIDDVSQLLMIEWAKEKRKRPIANLLFLGPTGTGKTELAKAMAEYLYGDEKSLLYLECPSFSGPEAKTHLIGTPVGYVGSGQGGKLTRPVINNPKRVILFDEVEKAYSGVFDLFLPMMGDGRLTEQGSGEVADFTQSVIILTSNAEAQAIGQIQEQVEDYHEMVNAVKSHLASSGVFRPEIIGRIDRVYVFKPLEGIVIAEIAVMKMISAAKEYGLELQHVDPQVIFDAMVAGAKLAKFGIRELDREISAVLGPSFVAAKQQGAKRVRIGQAPNGDLQVELV